MPTFALVTPYLPAPANTGGRIRMHRLALALARHGPVDLYARAYPVEFDADAGDLAPALSVYRAVEIRSGDLGCGIPWIGSRRVRAGSPRALRAALESAHRRHPYSAVIACHSYAWATVARLHGTVRVLDEHNIESRYVRAIAPDEPREAQLLGRWEQGAWREADLVTACTDDDATVIREHRMDGRVGVVPNGVDVGDIPFVRPSERKGHDVLFIGAMSHAPNVRAALELVREVLPLLRRSHPDATVTLCGRAPSAEIRALACNEVTVTGTVPSVGPFLARASAYANLVREGGGSSLKVPEALAAGLPLVSTRIGIRGHALCDGRELRVAEHPRDVAEAIATAWNDLPRADAMALKGLAYARKCDWFYVGQNFVDHVMAAMGGVSGERSLPSL